VTMGRRMSDFMMCNGFADFIGWWGASGWEWSSAGPAGGHGRGRRRCAAAAVRVCMGVLGILGALLSLEFSLCAPLRGAEGREAPLRVGHFPNLTHAQALVARHWERGGRRWMEERVGVEVQWFVYTAGPSAMEAVFAHSVDLTYVGPSPVLNAFVRSKGREGRVIAGAVWGGAALVVQGVGGLSRPEDFRGKRIATPQLGNTQDVAARVWLQQQGYRITQLGGDVLVLPTENADQLALFKLGRLDGAWTVEPWVSRLELEAGGRVYLEQRDAVTTVLAAGAQVMERRREVVRRFAAAHAELTDWINAHPAEAQAAVQAELKELTRREMAEGVVARAWPRLRFSTEVEPEAFETLLGDARGIGFLRGDRGVEGLVEKP